MPIFRAIVEFDAPNANHMSLVIRRMLGIKPVKVSKVRKPYGKRKKWGVTLDGVTVYTNSGDGYTKKRALEIIKKNSSRNYIHQEKMKLVEI